MTVANRRKRKNTMTEQKAAVLNYVRNRQGLNNLARRAIKPTGESAMIRYYRRFYRHPSQQSRYYHFI